MARYIFRYPKEFVTLPDYSEHRDQVVEVIRPLRREKYLNDPNGEFYFEGEAMFLVRADDGWEGHAWRGELEKIEEQM